MKQLHFSIIIRAPREHVFATMLNKPTYEAWTHEFCEWSSYQGDWSLGSEIRFVSTHPGGLISRIVERRENEFISIEHRGIMDEKWNAVFDWETVAGWAWSHENYAFLDHSDGTEVRIDQDIDDAHEAMMSEMWPKALLKLKEVCERT